MGSYAGIFISLFNLNLIVGNLVTGFLLLHATINTHQLAWILVCVAAVGVILLLFIRYSIYLFLFLLLIIYLYIYILGDLIALFRITMDRPTDVATPKGSISTDSDISVVLKKRVLTPLESIMMTIATLKQGKMLLLLSGMFLQGTVYVFHYYNLIQCSLSISWNIYIQTFLSISHFLDGWIDYRSHTGCFPPC